MLDRRIGAQLYTVRDYMQNIEDFDKTCKKISAIGYKLVQISGTPLKADEMKCVLNKYNLEAVTSHRNFDDFLSNLDEIIDYNKTLGIKLCGIGSMPWGIRADREAIDRFIPEADKTAKLLKDEGMLFGYHHHAFEFSKLEGRKVMDELINNTDPEAFNFIVDTYWLQVGGVNPSDFIKKLGKRAMAVHFKDLSINPSKDFAQEMAEVGEGNLDFTDIINACDEAGTKWALVEQDFCNKDPFDSLKISYQNLTKMGFK